MLAARDALPLTVLELSAVICKATEELNVVRLPCVLVILDAKDALLLVTEVANVSTRPAMEEDRVV